MTTLTLNGIGHYAAIEAPDRLAKALVGQGSRQGLDRGALDGLLAASE